MENPAPLYSLDKLKEIDDAEEFLLQVVNIFLETVPPNSAALVKACTEENWEQVYFFAHKIKANVALLSIDSITEEVKLVERCAKEQYDLDTLPQKISFIDETVQRAAEQMKLFTAAH
jgi:primosomal protein N''